MEVGNPTGNLEKLGTAGPALGGELSGLLVGPPPGLPMWLAADTAALTAASP